MQRTNYPNRKVSPPNKKFEELNLENPENIKLENGLDIYLIESGLRYIY